MYHFVPSTYSCCSYPFCFRSHMKSALVIPTSTINKVKNETPNGKIGVNNNVDNVQDSVCRTSAMPYCETMRRCLCVCPHGVKDRRLDNNFTTWCGGVPHSMPFGRPELRNFPVGYTRLLSYIRMLFNSGMEAMCNTNLYLIRFF